MSTGVLDGAGKRPAPWRRGGAALPTLLLVVFINLLGFGVVVPLLPFYGQSFHAPAWQIALVFSAYSIGAFFGEPFWGRLSDRIGRKPILMSTIAGNCLCYGALAFAPNVAVAFGVRLLGGLASGNGSVIQGYIADVTPVEHRAGRMALLGAAFNIGFIVGPALGGLLARPEAGPIGFRIPLLIASALAAISATCVALFVRESRTRTQGATARPSRWAMLGVAVRDPVVSRTMLVTFLAGCAFTGVESIFGLWTQHRFHWGPRQVGEAFAAVGVTAALCQTLLTGRLSRRFGEARMLAVGMAVATVCTGLQALSNGGWMTVPLLALTALGQSVAWPNVSALISRTADPDHQGQLLGLNNACGALSRVAGPFAAGLLFSGIGVDAPLLAGAAVTLPAILLSLSAGRAVLRARRV